MCAEPARRTEQDAEAEDRALVRVHAPRVCIHRGFCRASERAQDKEQRLQTAPMLRTCTHKRREVWSKCRRRALKGEEVHVGVRPIIRTVDKPRLRRCRHLDKQ